LLGPGPLLTKKKLAGRGLTKADCFRLQVVEAPRISRQPANESGKVFSQTHWLPLPYPGDNLGTHFC